MSEQPRATGRLAEIFRRRRIACGTDSKGRVVLARPDSVLVRLGDDRDRRRVLSAWVDGFDREQARQIAEPDPDDALGFVTVRFDKAGTTGMVTEDGEWSFVAADRERESLAGEGLHVELNHVVLGATITGNPLGAPASWADEMVFTGETVTTSSSHAVMRTTAEPAIAPPFLRQPLRIPGRRAPKVLVLDSGLRTMDGAGTAPEHTALESCRVHEPWSQRRAERAVDDEDEPDVDDTGTLDFEAGHGTFISGIVRQVCPDAEIHTAGVLSSFGEGSVSGVLRALQRVLRISGPFDVVVMSFGAFFTDDDPGLFATELRKLLGGAVGVAAAGNLRTCRPYFPAAMSDVIGVGALAAEGRAWFSNFGGWVDACAPAVDVVSTFFGDAAETIDGIERRRYLGWARWSGTSFAAPKVAALLAQHMYLHGGTAREAWTRMTSSAHLRYPDLGVVFNV